MSRGMSPSRFEVVQFSDESTGVISSWQWEFGDGGTSSQQNPIHTYSDTGGYDVTLTDFIALRRKWKKHVDF